MEAIEGIDLSGEGVPSLILRDLSEYATLAFVAAFDVPNDGAAPQASSAIPSKQQPRAPGKRVTYIGISKKTMPLLVDRFLQFKDQAAIFVDGTVEAICTVCRTHSSYL